MFKFTDSGLKHVVGKIDENTYFADPQFFRKLNKPAFSESAEITSTPEVAPQKEGLLASAYRMMTASFTIRTPKNVTTRTRKKSNPVKLVSPSKISGSSTETVDSDRKVPPP